MGVIAAAKLGVKSIVWLVVALLVLMFINDGPAEYRDVSHKPAHAVWVGQRCRVLTDLVALGVTHHLGPNEITDFVKISKGGSGPEITFSRPIHSGMELLITGVERCTNCSLLAFGRIRYAVTVTPDLRDLAPYRIVAPPNVVESDQVHCVKDVAPSRP